VHGKFHVEITQTAEGDVDEIWTHISADSIESATRFVMQLEEKIGTLERMPHRCPAIPENNLLGTQYRHLILGDYRVIFRVEASTVLVLRSVQGNRLLDTSFFGEGGPAMPRKSR
jgi:plasmid stabilization system protein ParE